jgi:hypothetical protein
MTLYFKVQSHLIFRIKEILITSPLDKDVKTEFRNN